MADLFGELLQMLHYQLPLVHQFGDEQAGADEGDAHHGHAGGGVGLRKGTEQLAQHRAADAQRCDLPAGQKTARQHDGEQVQEVQREIRLDNPVHRGDDDHQCRGGSERAGAILRRVEQRDVRHVHAVPGGILYYRRFRA